MCLHFTSRCAVAVTFSCVGYKNVTLTVRVKELAVSWLDVVLDEEEGRPGAAAQHHENATAAESTVDSHLTPKEPRPLLNGAGQRHERILGWGSMGQMQGEGFGLHLLGLHVQAYMATMVVLFTGLALALALHLMGGRTKHRTLPFRGKKVVVGR